MQEKINAMDRSIDSIGSCSLDADSTDFSGNFLETGKKMNEGNGKTCNNKKKLNIRMQLDDLVQLIKSHTCTNTHD